MSIVTSRDVEIPLLFEDWLIQGRRLIDRSKDRCLRWEKRAQGLTDRGEGCPELDAAIAQVRKTLEVESWFLSVAKYDVEECMVIRADQKMAKQYRSNTNADLKTVRQIAKELTKLKDLD
jgi:hypothetical protein